MNGAPSFLANSPLFHGNGELEALIAELPLKALEKFTLPKTHIRNAQALGEGYSVYVRISNMRVYPFQEWSSEPTVGEFLLLQVVSAGKTASYSVRR